MENDPTTSTTASDEQFKRLRLEPLPDTPPKGDGPLVVVIDGFDECDDNASQTLGELFRDYISELPCWVKFFLTSRPVRVVDHYFRSPFSIHHINIDISHDNNLRDCKSFIATQILELKVLPWATPPDWPLNLEDVLVEHARGLFIWVSVVMEYLRTKSVSPVVALEELLDEGTSRDNVPAEEQLDVLYTAIFNKCNWRDKTFKHNYPIVMGAIVAAKSPLSIMAWEALLTPLLLPRTSVLDIVSDCVRSSRVWVSA